MRNNKKGQAAPGGGFEEEYKKTFFQAPGAAAPAAAGGGGWTTNRIIFLAVAAFVVFFGALLLLGPLVAVVATAVVVIVFALGPRFMSSKYFPYFVVFVVIAVLAVAGIYFIGVGGLQAGSGVGFQFSQGLSGIVESGPFRQISNFIQNPFGVSPTAGQFEDLPPAQTPSTAPNQAFTIETRGATSTVAFNQPAITFFVRVNNAGAQAISRLVLLIDSGNAAGCLHFDTLPSGGTQPSGTDGKRGPLFIAVDNISPFSSKEVVITSGKIDGDCMARHYSFGGLSNVNTPFFITVNGFTYYPTSSRLAVERINTTYGALLFQNQVLRQEKVGAIFQSGTAVSINMDAGDQPVLDTVTSGGLIMNWINNGGGKIPKEESPFIFVITPRETSDFGQCRMNLAGENIINTDNPADATGCGDLTGGITCMLCDAALYKAWCEGRGITYTIINDFSKASAKMFDWACEQYNSSKSHVCATNALTEEFNVFNCDLSYTTPIPENVNRHTEYITAVAIYPYQFSAPTIQITSFCTESGTSACPDGSGTGSPGGGGTS